MATSFREPTIAELTDSTMRPAATLPQPGWPTFRRSESNNGDLGDERRQCVRFETVRSGTMVSGQRSRAALWLALDGAAGRDPAGEADLEVRDAREPHLAQHVRRER